VLTIFTIPKPFEGQSGIIQRNALHSWTLLRPSCEIILCGDDPGVKEASVEFGVKHLPDIAHNEFGTPLLNSAFEAVATAAQLPVLCYVNADIILLDDLLNAIRRIPFEQFLAVGRRINVDITEQLDFEETTWRLKLRELADRSGQVAEVTWIDYFVFTLSGELEKIPPFAVGRPEWDNWFIYNARNLHVPVVDISRVCAAIHQNHDYRHVPQGKGNSWYGPEADQNHNLAVHSMKGSGHLCNIWDATHILGRRSLLPAVFPRYLHQRWYTTAALHPSLRPIVDTLDPIVRPRRWIRERLVKRGLVK
jgi:hypothetical protein